MAEIPPKHLHEKVTASRLLLIASGSSSATVDAFGSWLLGGFAAALALLLSQLPSIQTYLPVAWLCCAATLFLVAAGLATVAKFIAAVVAGATRAAETAQTIGERLAEKEIEVDFGEVFREMERGTLPPMRWLVRRAFTRAAEGDLAASARGISLLAQLQALLVLAEAVVLLWASGTIVRGLLSN